MKNLKLHVIMVGLLLISTGTAFSAVYYCPLFDLYDQPFNSSATLASECDMYKPAGASAYNECVVRYNKLVNLYKSGKCKYSVQKTHTKGSTKCTVDYMPATKERGLIYCTGPNSKEFMDELEELYQN